MRKLLLILIALAASGAASAMSLSFTHPYGELVGRGGITVWVSAKAARDCSSTSAVNVGARSITPTRGGAAMCVLAP